ncbi:MAG TPA: single-stranded-DNA-specific exonuclease RecJ [Moraxellaceae bacterium]|nr:single-stranded-DNA-specific exonuclease RecJ [Moraxellaceae bacterium]
MKKIIRPRVLPADLPPLPDMHPVLARLYALRGVRQSTELERALKGLAPAQALKGLERALDVLEQALREGRRLLVVGDFDADGATSTALAVRVLRAMGADADYLVPNRFEYGYGLTPEIVALALRSKAPDVIITVDNGISSLEGVAAAHAAGLQVVITDHHLPGALLPDADAIVNPNQPDCGFPSKHLAGVGVIFYLLSSLRTRLKEGGWFAQHGLPEPAMADYLDLVALGTIADVVPLDSNNRVLVFQGLSRIRAGRCRPGISALLAVANKSPAQVVASDLAFQVAPRLNAAGRLDDMSHGIECLLTDSPDLAAQYATELDGLNLERRSIEAGMQQEALAAIRQLSFDRDRLPHGLVLFDRHWHQGVIGIVAGRIKDRYHRPVIAFAPAEGEGGQPTVLKGSARSIPGVHIRDVLDTVAALNPGLITRFGGHAMAAGLTLPADHLAAFRLAFDSAVQAAADPADFEPVLLSDGELPPECFSEAFVELLREAGPWGQGFPEPLFHGEFICLEQRLLKERHLKMSVSHPASNRVFDAIAFNIDRERWPNEARRVRLAYRLDINEFRGSRTLQLMVEYMEPVA